MTLKEKYDKSKRLATVKAQIALLEEEEKSLSSELCAHVTETGDDKFIWPTFKLSYVHEVKPALKFSASLFVETASEYMSPDQYVACKARSMKMSSGRKPYFR